MSRFVSVNPAIHLNNALESFRNDSRALFRSIIGITHELVLISSPKDNDISFPDYALINFTLIDSRRQLNFSLG